MARVAEVTEGLRVSASSYHLTFPTGRPYALLEEEGGRRWAELFLGFSLHTTHGLDDTTQLFPPEAEELEDGSVRITIRASSNLWGAKALVLHCQDDLLHATATVEGEGRPTDLHLFGGYYSGSLRFGSGFYYSGASFRSLFNPEPWGSERRAIPASESTVIDVGGSGALPGRRHWIFTPAPFCYAVSPSPAVSGGALRTASVGADQGGTPTQAGLVTEPSNTVEGELPAGPWMTLGLAAKPGEHLFAGYHYDGSDDGFALRLTYEGQTPVTGSWESPALLFQFGAPTPYEGLERYVARLEQLNLVHLGERGRPAWWQEPIFCGWGAQCHLSNLGQGRAPELATQANYDQFMGALAAKEALPGIVVIDDKWSTTYATCEADPAKWPDLKGWIAGRHAAGQHVLLWWKAWDPEGLPVEETVTNAAGLPVGADPSNPAYEERLRQAVRLMLSPEGYDGDGIKVDFSARTPSGPGLRRHGQEWGAELLRKLLWILYDEAKRLKPEALIMTHTPNPYFAPITDMIRLNDVNTGSPVVAQMTHRAKVARAACPNLLIDTDNWPMPNRAAWREYMAVELELGVPSLYFATDLDSMEPLEEQDYELIRQVFAGTRARAAR